VGTQNCAANSSPLSGGEAAACPRRSQSGRQQRADYRGGRDNRSHDQVETETSFARLILGAHNPLIRRYFLGVFRFAQMALADAGI